VASVRFLRQVRILTGQNIAVTHGTETVCTPPADQWGIIRGVSS